jgi:hypothetical protein
LKRDNAPGIVQLPSDDERDETIGRHVDLALARKQHRTTGLDQADLRRDPSQAPGIVSAEACPFEDRIEEVLVPVGDGRAAM